MNRDEQEMALWTLEYSASRLIHAACRAAEADAAVAAFRKRYPVEPAAPAPVWYDEPPFEKDGESYPCWVADWGLHRTTVVAAVYWYDDAWRMQIVGYRNEHLLAGRRVCPIAKPPEPPQ